MIEPVWNVLSVSLFLQPSLKSPALPKVAGHGPWSRRQTSACGAPWQIRTMYGPHGAAFTSHLERGSVQIASSCILHLAYCEATGCPFSVSDPLNSKRHMVCLCFSQSLSLICFVYCVLICPPGPPWLPGTRLCHRGTWVCKADHANHDQPTLHFSCHSERFWQICGCLQVAYFTYLSWCPSRSTSPAAGSPISPALLRVAGEQGIWLPGEVNGFLVRVRFFSSLVYTVYPSLPLQLKLIIRIIL